MLTKVVKTVSRDALIVVQLLGRYRMLNVYLGVLTVIVLMALLLVWLSILSLLLSWLMYRRRQYDVAA